MPQVSRNKLSKRGEEELINSLNLVFAKIQTGEEMSKFTKVLFTQTENLMLAKRLAVVVLIEENLSDSQIARALNITRMTVAKMRYFYESRGDGFKIALRRLEQEKKLDGFKKFLVSLAKYSVNAAGGQVKSPFPKI